MKVSMGGIPMELIDAFSTYTLNMYVPGGDRCDIRDNPGEK